MLLITSFIISKLLWVIPSCKHNVLKAIALSCNFWECLYLITSSLIPWINYNGVLTLPIISKLLNISLIKSPNIVQSLATSLMDVYGENRIIYPGSQIEPICTAGPVPKDLPNKIILSSVILRCCIRNVQTISASCLIRSAEVGSDW